MHIAVIRWGFIQCLEPVSKLPMAALSFEIGSLERDVDFAGEFGRGSD